MALFTNEVLTKYRADVSQEVQAIDQLIRKNEQLKQAEASAAKDRERHFDELVLDLTRAARAEEDLNVKTVNTTSGFQKFKGGMKSVSEAITPFNQGLELANKAIGFAKDGLEEYAKTSPKAAKQVKEIEERFASLKRTVLVAVGEMTAALLDDAVSLEKVQKKFLEIENTGVYKKFYRSDGKVRDLKDIATSFYGEQGAEELFSSLEKSGYIKRVRGNEGDPVGLLTGAFDKVKASIRQNVDYWNVDGKMFIDSVVDGFTKAGQAGKKAAEEIPTLSAEAIALAKVMQARRSSLPAVGADPFAAQRLGITSTINANIQSGPSGADLEAAYQTALAGQREFDTRESRYAASAGRRNQSKLEAMFGPIEDFNAYQTAFEMLGGSITTAMNAWIDGSMSAGQAIKKFLAEALKGLASQMAVEALKHGAYALGSLAFGDVGGAAKHGAAAAAFAGVAVAAGVAAKELGGGGAKVPSTGASGGSAGTGGGDNRDHRTGNGGQSILVVYADPFAEASARERALTAERVVKRALGGSGSQDN